MEQKLQPHGETQWNDRNVYVIVSPDKRCKYNPFIFLIRLTYSDTNKSSFTVVIDYLINLLLESYEIRFFEGLLKRCVFLCFNVVKPNVIYMLRQQNYKAFGFVKRNGNRYDLGTSTYNLYGT